MNTDQRRRLSRVLSGAFKEYLSRAWIATQNNFDLRAIHAGFWVSFGSVIVNSVDDIIEEVQDSACKMELEQLKTLILIDGNIENDDPNTKRILSVIEILINEFDQEVEYEDWTNIQGMEKDSK